MSVLSRLHRSCCIQSWHTNAVHNQMRMMPACTITHITKKVISGNTRFKCTGSLTTLYIEKTTVAHCTTRSAVTLKGTIRAIHTIRFHTLRIPARWSENVGFLIVRIACTKNIILCLRRQRNNYQGALGYSPSSDSDDVRFNTLELPLFMLKALDDQTLCLLEGTSVTTSRSRLTA